MAGSQVEEACAFCASTEVERLRVQGDLIDYRCLTCNKTWAEVLGEPASLPERAHAESSSTASKSAASSPPNVSGPTPRTSS